MTYKSGSLKDTQKIAEDLARNFKNNGGVVALTGDLGAGKTTFVQFFAKALGIRDKIISPTFVLIRQHQISNQRWLYHIDLYRLDHQADIKSLGIEELADDKNIVLIEWAEKLKEINFSKNITFVKLEKTGENTRSITIAKTSEIKA
jgi:tRNA threonylcarbamoyladenosine biosynthesis protein TsaE